MLESETAMPSLAMSHGVDTEYFSPRWRRPGDGRFCVGYVCRLTPEKDVRALVEIERELEQEGNQGFRILVVGAGSEEGWLRTHLLRGEFSVLLTDAAGRRVGVVDGERGLCTGNFAEGVRRLIGTPGLRERMGARAREHALERGWERVFEDMGAIYRSGLASGEVRARIRRAEERLAVG
jgi:hypothetical protein